MLYYMTRQTLQTKKSENKKMSAESINKIRGDGVGPSSVSGEVIGSKDQICKDQILKIIERYKNGEKKSFLQS